MSKLVYVDEQPAQANQVLRKAVASEQFSEDEVVAVSPATSLSETVELILEQDCRVLITDYRLSEHMPNVQFSGVDLVQEFQRRFVGFPCFVTTSYAREAVDDTIDINIIFPKSDFLGEDPGVDPETRTELPFFVRVRKKISEYESFVTATMDEWTELASKAELQPLTAEEVEKLLKLDDLVESIDGRHIAVEGHIKRNALQTFERIIEKAEQLIEKIEDELQSE